MTIFTYQMNVAHGNYFLYIQVQGVCLKKPYEKQEILAGCRGEEPNHVLRQSNEAILSQHTAFHHLFR